MKVVKEDIAVLTDVAAGATATPGATDADVVVLKGEAGDGKKLPERAIEHEDGSIELPLFVAVVLKWRAQESGSVTEDPPVTSVTFRRMTGKDVRVIMNAGGGDAFYNELTHASVRAQFPQKQKWVNILDRMDAADSAGCIRVAQYFLENGPRTPGPNTSPR